MSVEAAMIVQYVFCFEHMFKTHMAKDCDIVSCYYKMSIEAAMIVQYVCCLNHVLSTPGLEDVTFKYIFVLVLQNYPIRTLYLFDIPLRLAGF
jgi:hypothetical protein